MLETVKITSTKNLDRALNLRNLSPASPGEQEPAPLMTCMTILHVPIKENAREALAPYKLLPGLAAGVPAILTAAALPT